MNSLDDLKQIKTLDRENMAGFIADLPKQCLRAYQTTKKLSLPPDFQNIKNTVICGMGGSAIGGDLAGTIVQQRLKVPISIVRDYQLPNYVNEHSLVIVISYSGLTQETLNCAQEAETKRAKIIAVTTGHNLGKLAQENNWPLIKIEYHTEPRAALAWLLMPVLVILENLKLVDLEEMHPEESLELLENFNKKFLPNVATEKNIAKYLAYFCFDHLPVIIASEKFSAAARRWKTQFQENSENFAIYEAIPEAFHNFIEGDLPWRLKDEFIFMFFDSSLDLANLKHATKSFQKILDQENIRWESVPSLDGNLFLANLSYVLMGDWVSFYLAMLNQINPSPTEKIKWLHEQP